MSSFKVNDAVFVKRDGGTNLEGVVAFLGNVAFAEGDDWVGVRLTGSSAGQGKNDGSVQSQSYFKCPTNCGLFVRSSALETRKLTKIEELRLRRELASSGIPSISTPSTARRSSTAADSGDSSTPAGRQSRLDELRQRRAAISTDHSEANQKAIDDLHAKLKDKDGELQVIKEKLSTVEKEMEDFKEKAGKLGTENSDLKEKLKAQKNVTVLATEGEAADAPLEPESWMREKKMLEDQVLSFEEKIQTLTKQFEKQKSEHSSETTQLRSESLAYKNELQALTEQSNQRGVSDTSHYKEKAVLQAQIAALKRDVQDLKNEKIDLESSLEDLALDKEQLQEEKEALQEKLEEVKIDAETAQMEVEELRMELEETKASAEKTAPVASVVDDSAAGSAQSDDMAQALSIQNARLREALIRLREQASIEKMELTRQLKAVEKEAESAKSQVKETAELENLKTKHEEEIRELKDMVDQGAAFEGMVEALSDRLMEMEEQNVSLSTTIRELEEAAELTTEMEEVQAEELKAMARDMEDRDSVIRNMEEAIKMQRKREEDFSRTVGNYRSTVETLKKEKEALLEMQQGGEGEKSNLLASSQKALARAAQLVSDAAEMRKREALAALDKIEGNAQKHLASRLEKMLPRGVTAMEINAVKGELLVSRIAGLASGSLDGISRSFRNNMRGVLVEDETEVLSEDAEDTVALSDESKQNVANMMHQTECARVLISTGADAIRLLAAGQWPDLLSEQASSELGLLLGHTMPELELVLRAILKSLKEEGVIDTHQSHLDSLGQAAKTIKARIESDLEDKKAGGIGLPVDWKPPGMDLLEQTTNVKYTCLGAAAAVAAACRGETATNAAVAKLRALSRKLDALGTEVSQGCLRLAFLDVTNEAEVSKLTSTSSLLETACDKLFSEICTLLVADRVSSADLGTCDEAVEVASKLASQFSSSIRLAKLNTEEGGYFHPLSPESNDTWQVLSQLTKNVRSVDGDEDDLNFLMRARSIEHRLSEAVANEPKLAMANAKVASLEKSLATRSKEIAMQNARLSELEKLLAKSSARPIPANQKSSAVKSSEELNQLKEENRVLMEAMDVLQEQVAGYENEIRILNSTKTPAKGGKGDKRRQSMEPKNMGKRPASQRNLGASLSNINADVMDVGSTAAVGVLEAALFRPALAEARREAAKWRNKALSETLLGLPPLSVPIIEDRPIEATKNDAAKDADEALARLATAMASYRLEQASIRVVDLEKASGRSRALLRSSVLKTAAAAKEVDTAAAAVKRCLSHYGNNSDYGDSDKTLLGRVKLQGKEPFRSFPTTVTKDHLHRISLQLVS